MKTKTTTAKSESLRFKIKCQELKVRTAAVKLEIEKCKLALLENDQQKETK